MHTGARKFITSTKNLFLIEEPPSRSQFVPKGVLKQMTLDNGKIINIPVTQQVPPKTEDMITEQQQILSSLDAEKRAQYQTAPLRSDMEAFKAANSSKLTKIFTLQ